MAPSITSWWRLEARARDTELRDALEARIADPLWFIGRQWQFGEFAGVDGGTPVSARARLTVRKIGWYESGPPSGGGQSFDVATAPLEQLVEAERGDVDLRLAAAGGRTWLRLSGADAAVLAQWLAAGYVVQSPAASAPDLDGERLGVALTGRALDGAAVYRDVLAATAAGDFGSLPGVAATNEAAAPAYISWWEARAGRQPAVAPAWQDSRLEYELSVATANGDETVLTARAHRGGDLDWPSFDHAPAATLRTGMAPQADRLVTIALPTPVTFKGMPTARLWEFEESAVSFPAIDAAPDDLARLFAVEFALIYGNDFFVVPVRLPVGTLTQVDSLVVDDSFGISDVVGPSEEFDGPGSSWHAFKLSVDGRRAHADPLTALLLPAASIAAFDGPPIEEVVFARDDMAAMAWAIERTVPGVGGRPLDRALAADLRARRQAPATLPTPTGDLRYRLATEVPEHWYPLLPQQTGIRAIDFQLGQVSFGNPPTPAPLGVVLGAGAGLRVAEEELHRAGVRVRRVVRRLRWSDGTVRTWIGRRLDPGRGESASGLRFDCLETE